MATLLSPFFRSHVPRLILVLLILTAAVAPALADHRGHRGGEERKGHGLTTTCEDLEASPSTVVAGGSGTILFTCPHGSPALAAKKAVRAVPEFSLPAGYTGLSLVPHVSGQTKCTLGAPLVSNAGFGFSARGNFDYCASYSIAPASGLAPFTLEWKKAHGHGHGDENEHQEEDED